MSPVGCCVTKSFRGGCWNQAPLRFFFEGKKRYQRRSEIENLIRAMKVILRNVNMDLYFAGPNMWSNDPEKAVEFGNRDMAVKQARDSHLQNMEMVLSVSGLSDPLRLPVE